MVLPDSPCHNVFTAFKLMNIFESLSTDLAVGHDLDFHTDDLNGDSTDSQIADFAKAFDRTKLQRIKVLSVNANHIRKAEADNPYDIAFGISEKGAVDAVVKMDSKVWKISFTVMKIDGNWRISGMFIHE